MLNEIEDEYQASIDFVRVIDDIAQGDLLLNDTWQQLALTEAIMLNNSNFLEYQYPLLDGFTGSELCRHTSTVPSYNKLEGDDFLIIGGYESGIDAAVHLSNMNKKVRLFDLNAPWLEETSDPSVALSTFSFERMNNTSFEQNTKLFPHTPVKSVSVEDGVYVLKTQDGQTFSSTTQPLLAGGFSGSHKFVSHLFDEREAVSYTHLRAHET